MDDDADKGKRHKKKHENEYDPFYDSEFHTNRISRRSPREDELFDPVESGKTDGYEIRCDQHEYREKANEN